MNKPHKDSSKVWTYYRYGKDVWGRTVYAAYFMGRFAGYRYRLTQREIERRRQGIKQLGVPRWVDCPEWCVIT